MDDAIAPTPQPEEYGFTVGSLVATSLDAFLSAASVHLGEAMPDGRTLENPDPLEAWLAILSASALLDQLGPVMNDAIRQPFTLALRRLLDRFAQLHPDAQVPAPGLPVGSLKAIVQEARAELAKSEAPAQAPVARPGSGPLNVPGTGLPGRSTGQLNVPGTGLPGRGTGQLNVPGTGLPGRGTGPLNVPGTGLPGRGTGPLQR